MRARDYLYTSIRVVSRSCQMKIHSIVGNTISRIMYPFATPSIVDTSTQEELTKHNPAYKTPSEAVMSHQKDQINEY